MIFGFHGNQRGGKSLGMTLYSIFFAELFDIPIYANYTINHRNFVRFDKWRQLEGVSGAIICIDEVNTMIDSRNFKSKEQIYFTHLFQQMGKLGNTFMYTAQRHNLTEKRVREQTDYFIECTRHYPGISLSQEWYDGRRNALEPEYINTIYIDDPRSIYGWYNSFEQVLTAADSIIT